MDNQSPSDRSSEIRSILLYKISVVNIQYDIFSQQTEDKHGSAVLKNLCFLCSIIQFFQQKANKASKKSEICLYFSK